MKLRLNLSIAAILAVSSGLAYSGDTGGGPPCIKGQPGRGGTVTEHSRQPGATFIVHLTDFDHEDIPGQDRFPPSIADGHGGTTIAPLEIPVMDGLCDARNDIILPEQIAGGGGGAGGPKSDLSIESVHYDPITQRYQLLNIWGTISQQLGDLAVVAIPDLFIANSNGLLDGVTLYSLVDLAVYVHALPVFAEGEGFNIVNGQVASLPGMRFSTTPFTFDPVTGFSDPPYTGMAIAEAQHGFTPGVPEPSSVALLAGGMAALLGASRRSKKAAL